MSEPTPETAAELVATRLMLCAVCFTMKNIRSPYIVCARCALTHVEATDD